MRRDDRRKIASGLVALARELTAASTPRGGFKSDAIGKKPKGKILKRVGPFWDGGTFVVTERDTSGMRGTQDKFLMMVVDGSGKVTHYFGSHPALSGGKKFYNSYNLGEKEGKKSSVARELTARRKFTARVSAMGGSKVHWVSLYSPVGYKALDESGSASEFAEVRREAEALLKAAVRNVGISRAELIGVVMDLETREFRVDAKLHDQREVATAENVVFALEEDAAIKSAWVD